MSVNQARSIHKWTLSLWQRAVLFGIIYLFCAEAGSYLSPRGTTYVSFWMPAGLSVAVLLLNETRDWPWLLLAMLPANLIFDFFHGTKLEVAFLFYCANAVQSFLGAWLMRRFVTERPAMRTVKEFVSLLAFGASFSTMAGAIIGAATLVHFGFSNSFRQSWIVWWDSTAMAVLVLTPFILAWFSSPKEIRRVFNSGKKILEAAFLLAGFSLALWYLLVLDKGVMSPSKFMVIPFLLWAALRFGVHGATASVLLTALTLSFFTTQFFLGLTPAQISSGEYIFVLQMVSAMGSLIAVTPAVVLAERDQSLSGLRESEERFKNLSAAAFEGICISENGKILDVNSQYLKMFGYQKRDEVIGRQIIEFVTPEWKDSVAGRIRTEQETIYGHQLLRKDGSTFFAEAQAKIVRVGERTLRMTALRDITERKESEQALQRSEELFRAIVEDQTEMIVRWKPDGTRTFVNDAYCRTFGGTREQFVGSSFFPLISELDREIVLTRIRSLTPENPVSTAIHRSLAPDGKVLWQEWTDRAIFNEAGQMVELQSTGRDITDRKQAEAERAEAEAREQQARLDYTLQLIASQEAERTRIAAELHDSLGQNLLLIKNHAQLALIDKKISGELSEQLAAISAIATQSIAEARGISHDLHPYQLDHLGLTRALDAMIDKTSQSSGIIFKRKLDNVDDLFSKDAAMNLYRIVQESLNNILKHSRAKNASVTLERDVHEAQLAISDDGCGFSAGKNGKGMGLKNIAERARILGGKLKVDSHSGNGTRIEIKIPISAEAE